jgi:hypothetical membrane protein
MAITRDDVGALCGILGPSAFVGAWLLGGALTDGYDPLADAISRLAAEGADTQPLMTSGFVAFGLLVPVWAQTLGRVLDDPRLRGSVTFAGIATLGVAAFPLTRAEGQPQDVAHAVAAGLGYLAMAVSPLIGAAALRRAGKRRAALASAVVGAVSSASLVGTLLVDGSGGLQRLGLTVVDLWYVVLAIWVLRRR